MKTTTKSKIFKTAWELLKANIFTSFSKALKASWAKFKLISRMKSGIARFVFKKKDGSERAAIGTLREGNFNYLYKGGNKTTKPNVIKYFDIEKNAFRSFLLENLLAIS